jgi:hypothetical protein
MHGKRQERPKPARNRILALPLKSLEPSQLDFKNSFIKDRNPTVAR